MNELSRQRKWQKKKMEQGLCYLCGKRPINLYAFMCDECQRRRREAAREKYNYKKIYKTRDMKGKTNETNGN